ncbi:diguanylate cyclase [Psychrosphaera sp. B3R10]|uniref:sensor domain-containing diguanylate cyclase n=1 Tax=unclassified Psychrosphaera TaxID=2641570 RepID=UPI001C098636|nr:MULTISPECIES: sensor domain-containing diguanylate cyclase [unclassified Psychrosphaera]MBU2883867.1 diguanylate cyclase [Psychrosphaera sp. I2R16]MBU2988730.1 diguanylate cyclase [Psychrosphaera sp. B3R10]
MDKKNSTVSELMSQALHNSKDIVALSDSKNRYIYCNAAFAGFVDAPIEDIIGQTFSTIVRSCFTRERGILIETDNIDEWLAAAESKQRSDNFRTFEVDLYDGRWIKVSEFIVEDCLFLHGTDITSNKSLQFELEHTQEQLRMAASTDFLTGIYNRRQFSELAETEIDRSTRYGTPLTLLIFDLDLFKEINDKYGHAAGDEVLKEFVERIKTCLRPYDVFARIGGEEFALLLPNTDATNAKGVANRCLKVINGQVLSCNGHNINLTTSIGVSKTIHETSTLDSLLVSADQNLYKAKKMGRNQVVAP